MLWYKSNMGFGDLKLESSSGDIMIRTLNESDLDTHIQLLKEWSFRDLAHETSDSEARRLIKACNRISFFYKCITFLIFKNDTLIGSFVIVSDIPIALKIQEFKKPIFHMDVNFVEDIDDTSITISIKLVLDLISIMKIEINTLYIFERSNEKYITHFINCGFMNFSSEHYRLKRHRYYKGSNVLIKNIL